jgi:predicted MFS family arabinose efflux permease
MESSRAPPSARGPALYNSAMIPASERTRLLTALVAVAVAIAFADSSIVVLALPELYGRFNTSIEGISWVVTAYNAAVAVTAFALLLVVHRLRARWILIAGLLVFFLASVTCALANSLWLLIAARCVQGAGAALLLAGALPVLGALTGAVERGAAIWTLTGTFGLALGPALGGMLTQAFDWRAIFAAQAPVAAFGLVAALGAPATVALEEGWRSSLARTLPANVSLGLLFGSLVGVLFLAVLLVITVWGHSPIGGAAIVSVLPAAIVAARPLGRRLGGLAAVCGGAGLVAAGLGALALLPSASGWLAAAALAICGVGLGLAIPPLSAAALDPTPGLNRSGTFTIGVRHLGLVVALASIAPLLAAKLPAAGDQAKLKAAAVLLDAPVGLSTKVPVALDLAGEFERAQAGEIPDLAKPFDEHGAGSDPELASTRDILVGTVKETITRAFRPAFLLSAAFAVAAAAVALLSRRRILG